MKTKVLLIFAVLMIFFACSKTVSTERYAQFSFYGSEAADQYTKIIDSSLIGMLAGNYFGPGDSIYPEGFISTSQKGLVCYGQFWTRDGGTCMRELVHYGYLHHAKKEAACLIKLVQKNKDGFYSFPMYFSPKGNGPADEMDGTTAIIIGMVDLWKALDEKDSMKSVLYNFLHNESSPVRFIHQQLGALPLMPGAGEFGPGMGFPGTAYNVVQNYLCTLALLAGKEMETIANDKALASVYEKDAETIKANMLKYLVGKDSAWIWCIDTKTMKGDPRILNDTMNVGFGGIQGVSCMYADVLGLDPANSGWQGVKYNMNTFAKLYSDSLRKNQFEKYGIWTQFDKLHKGYLTSPSYGQGYAMQTMLLYDKLSMVDSAIAGFSKLTINPCPGNIVHRTSKYHVYERYFSPDNIGKSEMWEGCGTLNLVNVTEQLKVGRLIIGIDDHNLSELKLYPRLPYKWTGFTASNMPVQTTKGLIYIDISYKNENGKLHYSLKIIDGKKLEKVSVRLPDGKSWKWFEKSDVSEFNIIL
jgi:hypothetical protein